MSYSYLDVDGSALTTDDRQSSYYSYDAHGNVEWLVQQIPGLGKKHIRYEYDLISGKVLQVNYQEQTAEQFYHRYSYDEDNRLTVVETSKDGVIWEKDATYSYYRHGPLQRIELGEDRVQGVDYTYTIHGWLKAINHPDLTAAHDPGQDGRGIVPADAFGMALSYYEGDYVRSPQNGGLHQDNIQKPLTGKSLYNGNISSWTSQIQKATTQSGYPSEGLTAEQFRYDELNRIKSTSFAVYQNGQFVDKDDYHTDYEYDGNGNILKLNRNAYKPQGSALQLEMDRLTYRYYPGTNRLRRVEDGVATADWTEDIESQPGDQDGNNYIYDGLGQLIHDEQDKTDITWTAYNKVSTVRKSDGSRLIEYFYDGAGNRAAKKVTEKQGAGQADRVTTTYYVRDAQGNVLAVYDNNGGGLSQKEVYLYGSSRLGVYKPLTRTLNTTPIASRELGSKEYELTDQLGNVRAVVGDYRAGGGSDPIRAALRSYYHYYCFGQQMPGRSYLGSVYRFGNFNGKENDTEWSKLDFGGRVYDARLGRWLSTDPKEDDFPGFSPYNYSLNSPLMLLDPDGESPISIFAKMIVKRGLREAVELAIKKQIKDRIADYAGKKVLSKAFAKTLAKDADDVLSLLDQDWWEYAIELVPVAGDIYGGAQLTKKGYQVWERIKALENRVEKFNNALQNSRGKLKKSFESGFGKKVMEEYAKKGFQAHHIIPVGILEKNEYLQEAVAAGWDINGRLNGKMLKQGFHTNHRTYNDYVDQTIRDWGDEFKRQNGRMPTGAEVSKYLNTEFLPNTNRMIDQAREIYDKGGKNRENSLNNFFKSLGF